jgi:hypothetical protein
LVSQSTGTLREQTYTVRYDPEVRDWKYLTESGHPYRGGVPGSPGQIKRSFLAFLKSRA